MQSGKPLADKSDLGSFGSERENFWFAYFFDYPKSSEAMSNLYTEGVNGNKERQKEVSL